ncbi:uncharacterized protein STEHIDRAFT_123565 [Stereum hirsutum FP-91666 SS1]|uniref:uncharacterized protein n=1 Tax=Stereum hirsutum (strain FP-91666) TaxID=721885 RepID=UPI0004449AA0|nr:uncharacterized protein STEHIDRAFT_123565 [Stereum hirsutum FP-91666 SS1]EIM84022.1 hypothetical protein STEHIDRAFT_123565 [Stereum hirsutum FP-91666 SS1]
MVTVLPTRFNFVCFAVLLAGLVSNQAVGLSLSKTRYRRAAETVPGCTTGNTTTPFVQGDTCEGIAEAYNVTLFEVFINANLSGKNCDALNIGDTMCIQANDQPRCILGYLTEDNVTCDEIIQSNHIPDISTFIANNGLDSNCTLRANETVCVDNAVIPYIITGLNITEDA